MYMEVLNSLKLRKLFKYNAYRWNRDSNLFMDGFVLFNGLALEENKTSDVSFSSSMGLTKKNNKISF